jgi:hypothetical protein
MNLAAAILISSFLLLGAVALMVAHVRSWRLAQHEALEEEEYDYRRRQFRRRIQTSAMLGIVAAGLLAGSVFGPYIGGGVLALAYWGGAVVLACWVVLLAAVDAWATMHHFSRVRHRCIVEQAKLRAEIHRIEAAQGNGRPPKSP